MKNFTAYLLTMMMASPLLAKPLELPATLDLSQSLNLAAGDFVKGELALLANADTPENSADLYIQFADHSQRRLASNVFSEKEFMFKADVAGQAQFILKGRNAPLNQQAVRLTLIDHLPEPPDQAVRSTQQSAENSTLMPVLDNALLVKLQQDLSQQPENKALLLEAFWAQVKQQGTPLIEPLDAAQSRVTFLWRGARHSVRIFGGPTVDHDLMQQFPDTDIWFKSYVVPNDTQVSYRLAPDIPVLNRGAGEQRRAILATAQADPFNRFPYFSEPQDRLENTDKYNYSSLLILPNAPAMPAPKANVAVKGSLQAVPFESELLGNRRRLFVYKPANFDAAQAYPVLYLFDGLEFHTQVPLVAMLDQLIEEKTIPPLVAVLIENPSMKARAAELPPNARFAKALAAELVPFIERQAGIHADHRIIGGASYGGLAAADLALTHSALFRKALVMSGSFWWKPKNAPTSGHFIAEKYQQQPRQPLCIFMSAGYFESGRSEILQTSRTLNAALTAKGYPVIYREYATAHGYFGWQRAIYDGLIALFHSSFSTACSSQKTGDNGEK